MEPNIPQKEPYMVKMKEGQQLKWCACGHSKDEPYCDGSHNTVEGNFKSVLYKCEKDGEVWFCGCKHTKTPPLCDGSHNNL